MYWKVNATKEVPGAVEHATHPSQFLYWCSCDWRSAELATCSSVTRVHVFWNALRVFAIFAYLLGLVLFIAYVPKVWFTGHQWFVSFMQVFHGTDMSVVAKTKFVFIFILILLFGAFANKFQKAPVSLSVRVEYRLCEVWYLGFLLTFVETVPIG